MNQELQDQLDHQPIKKNNLIDDNNFKRIIKLQEEIYQATTVKASIKKLANIMIAQADSKVIAEKLIRQYS